MSIVFDTRNFQKHQKIPLAKFFWETKCFRQLFVIINSMAHQKFCTQEVDTTKNFQKQQGHPKIQKGALSNLSRL